MIYSNLTVTISGGESRVNEKIILYRGDRDIQVSFEIVQASFRFGKGENVINTRKAGYGQLIIDKPDDTYTFSEMTPCDDGLVVFTITSDMIDELTEVGLYSMQIRLFDETGQSRITLPPINDAIEVREPIATEDVSEIGEVGVATVDYAVLNGGEETEDIFDDEGMYKIMYWNTGDIITEGRLNRTEDAIYETNSKVENIVIPDTSDFITESEVEAKGYLTEHQSLTDYATKSYVNEEIAKVQLEGEGIDLSGYATKSYVDEAINNLRTELMDFINTELNSSDAWVYKDDDYTNATVNYKATNVYLELTASSYSNRAKEVLEYYPNCERLYLFDDGTVTSLKDMYNGEANGILRAHTVQFMQGYFENLTDLSYAFKGQTNLKHVKNIPDNITDFTALYSSCTNLETCEVPIYANSCTDALYNVPSTCDITWLGERNTTLSLGADNSDNLLIGAEYVEGYMWRGDQGGAKAEPSYGYYKVNLSAGRTYTMYPRIRILSVYSVDNVHEKTDLSAEVNTGQPYTYTPDKDEIVYITFMHNDFVNGKHAISADPDPASLNYNNANATDIKELVSEHLATLTGINKTLTLGETYLGYLTEEEKAAATAKGWRLV